MTQVKESQPTRCIYVVGLQENGGSWLYNSKFFVDEELATKIAKERKEKVFTLYQHEEAK